MFVFTSQTGMRRLTFLISKSSISIISKSYTCITSFPAAKEMDFDQKIFKQLNVFFY